SHAPRGNAISAAPRRAMTEAKLVARQVRDAERLDLRSHAERGNEALGELISFPLLQRVRLVDCQVREGLLSCILARPADGHAVDFVALPEPERDGQLALAQVAAAAHHFTLLDEIAGLERHHRADRAAVGPLAVASQREADPVVAIAAFV